MDRKGIIGILLAVIGLVSWQVYYTKETQRALEAQRAAEEFAARNAPPVTAPATPVTNPAAAPVAATTNPAAPTATPAPAPAIEAAPAQLEKLSTPATEYTFTNLGGGIQRALLLQHAAGNNSKIVLNEFGSIPIGAVTEIAGEGTSVPFTAAVDQSAGAVTFERLDQRQVLTTKRFTLPKIEGLEGKEKLRQEYLITLDLAFTNRSGQPVQLPSYFVHTGSAAPVHHLDQPIHTGFNWMRGSGNKFIDVNWFNASGFLWFAKPERPIYTETYDGIQWAGVTSQYFTTLVTAVAPEGAPADVQARQRGTSVWARRFDVPLETWTAAGHKAEQGGAPRHAVDGALGMPGFNIAPGQKVEQQFALYVGPGEYRRLRELGESQAEIMNFGIFGIVSKALLNSMNGLNSWFKSYALAIIVLTLIIKTLLWPLQNKATNSMKRMQALQPKMQELRDKYKDDPTKMNTEVMKLYKDYGVNPVGGCLPMLVQIPIFFGFYNMLGKAVELRNSSFLWVDDLSQPDTVWHLPGLGIPLNVLPLLMAITMFWQMAISPKSGDPIQQRVFMFVPLIFIFFCYNFASALALYWTVQNLFSIVQLYMTRNQAAPVLQKVAAPSPTKKKSRS
ncbi:MAG TPA: membrane protein insertase YidC [Chthoniobacteraceae bacterium]|jgi:YidC/Oxa1 family membrane protein insertase